MRRGRRGARRITTGGGGGGGGGQPLLFDMYSSGSYPGYAFGAGNPGPDLNVGTPDFYSISQQVNASPTGHDAVRITANPIGSTTTEGDAMGVYWPWLNTRQMTQGEAFYVRWAMRFNGAQDWRNANAGGNHLGPKFFILGTTCENSTIGEPTRVIYFIDVATETIAETGPPWNPIGAYANQNIGCGGPDPPGWNNNPLISCDTHKPRLSENNLLLPENVWLRTQLKIQSSTNLSTQNGYLAFWQRQWGSAASYTEGAPDAWSNDNFILSVVGWTSPHPQCQGGFFQWGLVTTNPLLTPSVLNIDFADFQVGLTFDPNWH